MVFSFHLSPFSFLLLITVTLFITFKPLSFHPFLWTSTRIPSHSSQSRVNETTPKGKTALYIAVESKRLQVVDVLLEANADPTMYTFWLFSFPLDEFCQQKQQRQQQKTFLLSSINFLIFSITLIFPLFFLTFLISFLNLIIGIIYFASVKFDKVTIIRLGSY